VADSADYDSTTMAWVPVRFDTVRAFSVDEEGVGGRTRLWVDGQGRLVRAEYPGGMVVQRSAFEIAYENFRNRDTAAFARASADPPPGAIVPLSALAAGVRPEGGRAAFRVRIGGDPHAAVGEGSGVVTRRGDTLEVRRPGLAGVPRRMLPLRDPEVAAWLAPEPLIPADDPRIVAQARQIVGRVRNARRAGELLVDWVHAEVRPEPGLPLPGALAALATRRGESRQQVALLVAFARAVGIPARPVEGLLYAGGRFYYHTWAELFIGEWVAADPLTGEFPAGAARIGLAVGAFVRPAELASLAGGLVLEVL
jgi:transglutaminase-like putative cysteine protease